MINSVPDLYKTVCEFLIKGVYLNRGHYIRLEDAPYAIVIDTYSDTAFIDKSKYVNGHTQTLWSREVAKYEDT